MNTDTRDAVTWTISTLIGVTILIGLATRLILIPYLRDHLLAPMQDVKRQVSENHHSNTEPTLPDRIQDVQDTAEGVRKDVKALSRVFDQHLNFSDRWVDLVERELGLIHFQIHKHHPDYIPPATRLEEKD